MSITKIVAILIPIIALGIWSYFFITVPRELYKFFLVIALIPLVFVSFYIAFWVRRKGKQRATIVRS